MRPGDGWENRSIPSSCSLVGSWFPGAEPMKFKDGSGFKIQPNGKLVAQMHYTQYNDEPQVDNTRIGLKFPHEPINREIFTTNTE